MTHADGSELVEEYDLKTSEPASASAAETAVAVFGFLGVSDR
jgi:hypothetical protein